MRVLRLLPFGLFVLLLLLPALSAVTGFAVGPRLLENRNLTPAPVWADYMNAEKRDWMGLSKHVNDWFSDGLPTRDFWVRLHGQLLYSLFDQADLVHIGKSGWLYYRDVLDVGSPSLERLSVQEREAMVQRLDQLSQLLAARGIALYLVPLTLKDYYYPEFLPASGKHALDFRFYDLFMDELLATSGLNVIDSRPVLRQAKIAGMKIFHQTDFHWTDPASAAVFKELLTAIALQEQKPALVDDWQVQTVTMNNWSGGESNSLPLLWPVTETTVEAHYSGDPTLFTAKVPLPTGVEYAAVTAEPRQDLLAPVLIYGDSFYDAAERAGFLQFFQGHTRSRIWDMQLVDAYRNRLPGTRYLVLENITGAQFGMDAAVAGLIEELSADVLR